MLRFNTAALAAGALLASCAIAGVSQAGDDTYASSAALPTVASVEMTAAALLPPGFTTIPGELMATLNAHSAAVNTLALAPDGTALFSGGRDGHVKVWDTATLELLLDIPACQVAINDIEVSADGTFIVTAAEDGYVKVWDSLTGDLLIALPSHLGEAESSGAVGRLNETIRSMHGTMPRFAAERVPSVTSAQAVAVSPDSLYVYSAGDDGYVRKYSVEDNYSMVYEVHANYNGTNDIILNIAGNYLYAGGMDGYVSIFDAELGTLASQILAYEHGAVNTLALTGELTQEACLLTGGSNGEIRVWDNNTGALTKIIRAHAGDVKYITTVNADTLIVSGGSDGLLKVWNRDAELAGEMQAHVLAVSAAAIAECTMFTSGSDFTVEPPAEEPNVEVIGNG
jgi:WD40 repeat protein